MVTQTWGAPGLMTPVPSTRGHQRCAGDVARECVRIAMGRVDDKGGVGFVGFGAILGERVAVAAVADELCIADRGDRS